jgi:hypothetical protein
LSSRAVTATAYRATGSSASKRVVPPCAFESFCMRNFGRVSRSLRSCAARRIVIGCL